MSRHSRSRWSSPAVRVGIVSSSLLVLGLILVAQQASQAEPASLSPQSVAVVPQKDKLHIIVDLSHLRSPQARGQLRVELRGPKGKVLAKSTASPDKGRPAHYTCDLSAPKAAANTLQLVCRSAGQTFAVPVKRVLLAKAHETALAASKEFYAGTTTALRCSVHRVR